MTEKPTAPLKLAATMLFIREGDAGVEVYMVVRNHAVDFASNAMVFPGGKVTPADIELAATLTGGPHLTLPQRALAVAALRESFEEAGLLLARGATGEPVSEAQVRHLDPLRALIDKGQYSFAAMLESEQLRLNLDQLYRFAHIITPKQAPKRFDTHFYIAACPPLHNPVVDMNEVVDGFWLTAASVLAQTERRYTLMRPTRMVLKRLAQSVTVEAALADAASFNPAAIEPEFQLRDGVPGLATPAVQGFPADWEPMDAVWAASVGKS